MTKEELMKRTKKFAVDVVKLLEGFPKSTVGYVVTKQLIRCSTSVAANYRAALRAQSHAHFISKISIVEEEADESLFWLEFAVDVNLVSHDNAEKLIKEADELTAIFTATRKTAKQRKK